MKHIFLRKLSLLCLIIVFAITNTASKCYINNQENLVYKTGTMVSDINFVEQWALYNKGTLRTVFPGNPSNVVQAIEGIDIDVCDAWKEFSGGKRETIIALIDTGVDYRHEELRDSIWINEDEIANDGIDNDGNGYIDDCYGWNFFDDNNQVFVGEDDSHGTHGAGTMVAAKDNEIGIAGIAGNSKIKVMVIKALGGREGIGTTSDIVKAIEYAKDNGAVICNLSFGTNANDDELRMAIEESNMLFVAASGNSIDIKHKGRNIDQKPIYPASYHLDNMITVANLNYDGNLHPSSNYGQKNVDLAAPGSYIISTCPYDTYNYMTGTSMATPMVTATAALLYSQYKDITLSEIKEQILSTVRPLSSLKDKVATGGMLDVSQAFSNLK